MDGQVSRGARATVQAISAAYVPPPTGRLVGRREERARLADLTAALAAGRGSVLLIEGEPGTGKSALLRAACAAAANLGCQVVWAACDERGQTFPLEPLLRASGMRTAVPAAGLGTVPASHRQRPGGRQGLRGPVAVVTDRLLAMVDELCAAVPVLLVVDDLQWADAVTATVWSRLVHLVHQRPLLLVGATRQVREREGARRPGRATGRTSRLRLGPLSESASIELVTALVGGTPGPRLRELADGAAGSPQRLTMLVEELSRSHRLTRSGGTVELTPGTVSQRTMKAIMDRLELLRPPVVEVLRAAALLGQEFHVADLGTVLRRPVADIFPLLSEAIIAGLLTQNGQVLAFRSSVVQAVLYEGLPASFRASWHAEAARALASAGTPVERVAQQVLGAPDDQLGGRPSWLVEWLETAAPVLVESAPSVAVPLLLRGLDQVRLGGARRERFTRWLAAAQLHLGEPARPKQVDLSPPASVPSLEATA